MSFKVGETIVHPVHGIGVVTRVDEVKDGEQLRQYYVIAAHGKLTLSVPVDTAQKSGLRSVASTSRLTTLFDILSSAAQPLNEQPRERQMEIRERFKEGTLEALCSLVRDLTARSMTKRLNESDNKMLKRARELLLDEWVLVMNVMRQEASNQLNALLAQSTAEFQSTH
jgi:CarD family transcriptional regulator